MRDLTAVVHVKVPDADGDDIVRLYHRILAALTESGLTDEQIGLTTMYGPPSKALHNERLDFDIEHMQRRED